MKNLFIIDGPSGTGKSDLLKYLTREKHEVAVLNKITTRDKRKEEEANDYILDLEFKNEEDFEKLKKCGKKIYYYGYRDKQYGFFKSELEDRLCSYDNVVVIIRNDDLPQRLKKDFPDVRVILVYIYTDNVQVRERLVNLGYNEEKIAYRIQSNEIALKNYYKNPRNYDKVLINDSDVVNYETQIDQLIAIYNQSNNDEIEISNREKFPLLKPLIGHKEEIMKALEKYPYGKNVFLMMRYRSYNEHLSERIEKIIKDQGFNCVRADMDDWDITRNVYNPIAVLYACKYGIALFDKPEDEKDMKNQFNPNVAYELGMMQLQRKDCLIFKHTSLVKIPFFDIMKDIYSEYEHPKDMDAHIEKWIKTKLKK